MNKFDNLDDVYGGIESPLMFKRIAERTVAGKSLGQIELGYYSCMAKSVLPKVLLDQTHPNIWNVEALLNRFYGAKFLGIKRNVKSVIYSMKVHGGVSEWAKRHNQYVAPNRFLGMTRKNEALYRGQLTDMQRDVFRWCAHVERLQELTEQYPESVLVIDYENLHANMRQKMDEVAEFIKEPPPTGLALFKSESLTKNLQLTSSENSQIDEALRLWRDTK